MVERSRQDTTRNLLQELDDGWATPSSSRLPVAKATTTAAPATPIAEDDDGALPSPSTPDVDALDEGWLDDLFPGEGREPEDAEADEVDEGDEPEPALPDERLDPEAFALAKKAREERAARKKEKKRAKAETKRARQKARAAAVRQKQKSKKARPASAKPEPAPKKKPARTKASEPIDSSVVEGATDVVSTKRPTSSARAKASTPERRGAPSTMASVKLLALVLAILLALAAAAAAIMK